MEIGDDLPVVISATRRGRHEPPSQALAAMLRFGANGELDRVGIVELLANAGRVATLFIEGRKDLTIEGSQPFWDSRIVGGHPLPERFEIREEPQRSKHPTAESRVGHPPQGPEARGTETTVPIGAETPVTGLTRPSQPGSSRSGDPTTVSRSVGGHTPR
jgi:hypothetical protein